MPKRPRQKEISLADLRRELDRIDAAMHALLIERGETIDRLIEVKKTQETGSAFRPAREAEMMRRLAERHHGSLPLNTVESIWRVIISTSPTCRRHSRCMPTSPPATRRCAIPRASISASPCRSCRTWGRRAWSKRLPKSRGDLGLVPAFAIAGAGPWWAALEFDSAPKIVARLPFVERHDHPAAMPVFVVSRAAADAMVTETEVWSMRVSEPRARRRPARWRRSPR